MISDNIKNGNSIVQDKFNPSVQPTVQNSSLLRWYTDYWRTLCLLPTRHH